MAYLTKRFPRLSETFILDEILGLEAAGVPLKVYAIADPGETLVQPDAARLRSGVTYIRDRAGWRGRIRGAARSLAAHARLAGRNPSAYRAALDEARRERSRSGTIRPFVDAGRLAVDLQRAGASHLHAAFAHGPATTARLVWMLTGLPYSFSAHAKDLFLSEPHDIAAKVERATFVLTCSAAAQAELRRIAPTRPITLAYHGVDTERFAPDPGRGAPRPDGPWHILAVGRLVPKKGYPTLLDALSLLHRDTPALTCRIVGGGPDRAELAAQAERLGLGSVVELVGARTHQQIAEEYRAADVFVQASAVLADGDRDGVPNSLLEAMSSGLPVVATRVAGIPEAIDDGESGILVPPRDPVALAAGIARLLRDPDLAARLGRQARGAIEARFDRRGCTAEIAALFGGARTATDRLVGHR